MTWSKTIFYILGMAIGFTLIVFIFDTPVNKALTYMWFSSMSVLGFKLLN